MERCIQQGMKPEEVGYQQQFSKQELRRVVTSYPGKEVRIRNLSTFYMYYRHVENQAGLQNTIYFCLITTSTEITVFSGRTKNIAK